MYLSITVDEGHLSLLSDMCRIDNNIPETHLKKTHHFLPCPEGGKIGGNKKCYIGPLKLKLKHT